MPTVISEAELKGLAVQALNMATRDLEQGISFNFMVAVYDAGMNPPLHRARYVEKLVVDVLGETWMNGDVTKDCGFAVLRTAVTLLPPDAVVIVSGGNGFKVTAKFRSELSPEQQQELFNASHARHHEAVKEGYLSVNDILVASAQTPALAGQWWRGVEGGRVVGELEGFITSQECLQGRLKMFGELDPLAKAMVEGYLAAKQEGL